MDWRSMTPMLHISAAEYAGGYFYSLPGSVAYHAKFNVVNIGRSGVTIDSIDSINFFGGREYEVRVDGARWMRRPITLRPKESIFVEYIVDRDVGQVGRYSDKRLEGLEVDQIELNNLYIEINAQDFSTMPPRITSPADAGEPLPAQRAIEEHFQSLMDEGYLFSGLAVPDVDFREVTDLSISYGGRCRVYLIHLPTVCTSLQVELVSGEVFESEPKAYGLWSEEIKAIIAEV